MPSGIVGIPDNALTQIIDGGGGGPDLPPVDPAALAIEHGMSDASDDDSPPAIHIAGGPGGSIRTISDPSRDQARARMRAGGARLGAPPQPRFPEREGMYAPGSIAPQQQFQPMAPQMMPQPMMGTGLQVTGIDMLRQAVMTNYGPIPLPADSAAKITKMAVAAMQKYFADAMKQTMQVYGMGGTKRVKRKRPRKKV